MNEKYTDDLPPDPNSKSQRKRDMQALQDLGAQLLTLPGAVLARCELPPELLAALEDYQQLPNKHGAQRRQLQFIGKVMRTLDEETLARIHAQIHQNVTLAKRRFQQLEQLRDTLLDGDRDALATYVTEHPDTDVQQLNQLLRQARRERNENKPPVAARRLFQLLREDQERDG